MKLLDATPTHFHRPQAEDAIAALVSEDEAWTYEIIEDPSGRSPYVRVRVLDEDGEQVGYL